MNLKILKAISLVILIFGIGLFNNLAIAETPQEFCDRLPQMGVTDPCKTCGEKCAVVVTNVGNKECYFCAGVGACKLDVTCEPCKPDYPVCVEE